MTLKPWHAADVPLTIKLKASQTGNAFQVKNSDGDVVYAVDGDGKTKPTQQIDITNIADGGYPVITAGSYSSPVEYSAASQSLLKLYYEQSADTGVDVCTFFFGRTTGQAGALGCTALVESAAASPGPKTLQGGQFMAGLNAGGYLATLGGDATAGMYGAWLKVYASGSAVASSGCRVAAVWLDNQMSCAVGGEEYSAFITTGGTVPDAVFGLNTSSSGWTALFNFDSTMVGKAPLSALKTASAASDSSIVIVINGSTKYIPVFDAAT